MTNKENNKEIEALLKAAVAPVKDAELRRDLWPQMLRKLDEQPARVDKVPWFDWALAAILSAVLFLFPGAIPALLYHL
ncbi:MAG TPA: hypothetical protein VGR03_01065 [Candidatus Acidoferrum sp.]|nr:hypothetical protein [Candidatus Acidoferrum sp.]